MVVCICIFGGAQPRNEHDGVASTMATTASVWRIGGGIAIYAGILLASENY